MAKNHRLQKTVQKKDELEKVVSRTFTTFTQPQSEDDPDTITELFRLYDKLYLSIPLEGASSHRYLIEQSSKLVDIVEEGPDIQPLLDEITDLRQRLLDANETINQLETELDNNGAV